jgi:hypothetical protein
VIGLALSAAVTALTLPERLLLALWLRLRGAALDRRPGPVIILGYYRSGTTHLQFLLNCDPNLYSPKWYQALSPQGFLLSWTLLRFLLLPFLSRTRPQDNVAFGSDVPAEDDFALNNWALASSLPGRHVLPRARDFYDRFHDLKDLSPDERARWRRYQRAFVRKLSLLAGRRRILLKTPSHTARVEALQELFAGTDGPRFIHISRDPHAVVRSNRGLYRALNPMYHLQAPLPPEELEARTVAEYLATEQSYLAARPHVPPGRLAELRLEDLQADPLGEVRRVYRELGLEFTEAFERRLLDYLDATRGYTPNVHPAWGDEQARRLGPALEPLVKQFGHDRPPLPPVPPPRPAHMAPGARRLRLALAGLLAAVAAAACVAAWLLLAHLLGRRVDRLVWPAGIAVGYAALSAARRGSHRLGLWAGLLTLLSLLAAGLLTTRLLAPPSGDVSWLGLWRTTAPELLSPAILFWACFGALSAYRIASRPWR